MSTELHTRALAMAHAPWAYSSAELTALIGELIAAAAKAKAELKSVLDRESETQGRLIDLFDANYARISSYGQTARQFLDYGCTDYDKAEYFSVPPNSDLALLLRDLHNAAEDQAA